MGVVTVPSSATRTTPLGPAPHRRSLSSRPTSAVVAFKPGRPKPAVAAVQKPPTLEPKISNAKKPKRVKAVAVDAPPAPSSSSPSSPPDSDSLDYNEVAAALENIYKLSPPLAPEERRSSNVVRSRPRGAKRLSLEKRVGVKGKKREVEREDEEVERLVRDYLVSTDLVSLDWKRMKIPPVLSAAEQGWLFGLMQPMKAIFQVKENLHKDLSREPTDGELASAVNMSVTPLRRDIEVGRAARNKLIKHNLRLVLFVINKYYQEMASGEKFQDLCQAGARGLITAIDRFEPKRGFRLSTYAVFWIRHSIIRSMTLSSFTRVSFGIESVRQEIQKAKLELIFELQRLPTEKEIISRVGISPERYHDVMKAAKAVYSLNARHAVTQEEFINGITDTDGVGGDKRRQPALLRLAVDDVLDSLKPKESLVIRQRYGLDGKGDRTLGEIAGNLNISREMVRKHELKALMKLKHPARVNYLRRYV